MHTPGPTERETEGSPGVPPPLVGDHRVLLIPSLRADTDFTPAGVLLLIAAILASLLAAPLVLLVWFVATAGL